MGNVGTRFPHRRRKHELKGKIITLLLLLLFLNRQCWFWQFNRGVIWNKVSSFLRHHTFIEAFSNKSWEPRSNRVKLKTKKRQCHYKGTKHPALADIHNKTVLFLPYMWNRSYLQTRFTCKPTSLLIILGLTLDDHKVLPLDHPYRGGSFRTLDEHKRSKHWLKCDSCFCWHFFTAVHVSVLAHHSWLTTETTPLHSEHNPLPAGKQWCQIAAVYLGICSNPNKDYDKTLRSLF